MTDEEIEERILEVEALIRASTSEYRQWVDEHGTRHIRMSAPYGDSVIGVEGAISSLDLKYARHPRLIYFETLHYLFRKLHYHLYGGVDRVGI